MKELIWCGVDLNTKGFICENAATVQTLRQRHDFSISGFIQVRIQRLILKLQIMTRNEDKERIPEGRG